MRRLLFLLAVVSVLFSGCTDFNDLNDRFNNLEQNSIPSVEEQIASIQESIKILESIDKVLEEGIEDLDVNIKDVIAELKKYVDGELKSAKDWTSATFATLAQLNDLSHEVALLKELVDQVKEETSTNLVNMIADVETSMKAWVGEQLSGYTTIGMVDAEIAILEKKISDGDSVMQEELNKLKVQLTTTESAVTEAYKRAIEEAITQNLGVINEKISNDIAIVNSRIDNELATINAKLTTLQAQVEKNTEAIAKLLARIQSVSYVPQYSDGKAVMQYMDGGAVSLVVLDFELAPSECVAELAKVWRNSVTVKAVYTKTRAVSFVDMPITKFESDSKNGIITVAASGENLSEEFFAGTQEASIALVISDGNNTLTSAYIPLLAKEEEYIPTAKVCGWAELPAAMDNDVLEYGFHDKLPSNNSLRNYSFCFDKEKHCSIWVAYPLHSCYTEGTGDRTDEWAYDPCCIDDEYEPNLKNAYYPQNGTSYSHSRGHHLPSADRLASDADNETTFYFTNMSPQLQSLNGGTWASLENDLRKKWMCSDTLYVVTGAHFAEGYGYAYDNKGKGKACAVPTHYYKVILRTKSGNSGKWVSDCSSEELQCVGFWFNHAASAPRQTMSVAEVEQKTGLIFFPNVPAAPKSIYNASDWQ